MLSVKIFNCTSQAAVFTFLFLCFTAGLVFAQQNSIIKPRFKFYHLQKELNNNQVSSICRDKYGFVWIGTLGGLHRFNGEEFELFASSDDSTSLPDMRIECVYEDAKGNLWIGTYGGLCLYNRNKNNFTRFKIESSFVSPLDPNTNRIHDIIEDSHGRLWVASLRNGLFYLDEKRNEFVPFFKSGEKNTLGNTHLTAICDGGNDVFWVGTADEGLKRLDLHSKKVSSYAHDPNNTDTPAGNYITDVVKDKTGVVWVATNFWGLSRIENDGGDTNFIHYKHDVKNKYTLGSNDVRQLYVDSGNNLWSCNENGGMNLYDRGHDIFLRYSPDSSDPFSLSSMSYWCIYEDEDGKLWFGSSVDGIDVLDKYSFKFDHYRQSFGNADGLNNNIIRSFYEDKEGKLWIATDGGGVNVFDRKKNKYYAYEHNPYDPRSIRSNAALSLCEGRDGELWIGTRQGGINILDYRTMAFSPFKSENQHLKSIFNIIKDREGNMWAGTYGGGASKYNPVTGAVKTYLNDPENPSSISSNIVPVIFEDSDGNMWIGTEDNGLNLLEKSQKETGIFRRFLPSPNDPTSLPSKLINHIFEDNKRNVWIASDGGLSKYMKSQKAFINYTTSHGLRTNHIKSIIEDAKGYLWIATSKGISKFDPAHVTFRNYDKNDGLQPGEFSRYCVYKTRNGELVFGGTNGFNIFMPDSIYDNPFLPAVYITGLKVFNRPIGVGENSILPKHIMELDEITLSYKHSVFTLDFVALNFTLPYKNQYAYKLDGLEDEWNYVGNQRSATYTHLDPDVYYFHVKAANNDGYWNETSRILKITITPPFWKTWWFRGFLLVGMAGSVYLILYVRMKQFRLKNLELENKVTERTAQLKKLVDELCQKQEEIASTNEELKSALEDLYDQKNTVDIINKELKKTHKQLKLMNSELDKRVQERTSKLLKANQELDRFVYSASHDLSAPLKSILGLIKITKLENHSQALTEHLNHMEKSVLKLENVIKGLTQFSRNMGHEVTRQEFKFNDMVEEVLDELKYPFQSQNIKIIKLYDDNAIMVSDYLRVKIVLTNLMSNALKYRDEQKPESFMEIQLLKENGFNVIRVRDNGIGIEAENKDKIFKMFFRGTDQSKGSGLGLYIVKETVEKLEGTIEVESESRKYSTFTVKIPA